jgi:hypothetical protein
MKCCTGAAAAVGAMTQFLPFLIIIISSSNMQRQRVCGL